MTIHPRTYHMAREGATIVSLLMSTTALGSQIPTAGTMPRPVGIDPSAESRAESGRSNASVAIESLARSVAGLEARGPLLGRLAANPEVGGTLLADDARSLPALPPASLIAAIEEVPVMVSNAGKLANDSDVARPAPASVAAPALSGVPVPEPASIILVVAGAIGLYIRGRLRNALGR